MGTKFREVNTLSFIGNIATKTERVWKEVDEEIDIIGCKEKFARACQIIKPLSILERDLPGDGDTRQVPIFVNNDVSIELMHCRASNVSEGCRPAGFYETQVQVQNKSVTKTPEGDFELSEGDVLVVPPNISCQHTGDGPTTRLIVYTREPVQIAQGIQSRRASCRTNIAHCSSRGRCSIRSRKVAPAASTSSWLKTPTL